MIDEDDGAVMGAHSSTHSGSGQSQALLLSAVISALAASEGVDLSLLRVPTRLRPRRPDAAPGANASRLLDWSGTPSADFTGPGAARRFFEEFDLFPGIVVRGWGHPEGRLGFSLDGDRVLFELHVPGAGLLIVGTPDTVRIALRDLLPETVCIALVGKPLERLVAWPPARGSDYVVSSVEGEDGVQMVTLSTTPLSLT